MTIIRGQRPNYRFTVVRNEVLQDKRMSFRARGILSSILSRPDNWRCSADDLANAGLEGRDAILTALKELEDHGYLVRSKSQNEKGHWISFSTVYDWPVDKPVDKLTTEVGLPAFGKPNSVNQGVLKETLEETLKPPNPQPKKAQEKCPTHKLLRPCSSCIADLKAVKPVEKEEDPILVGKRTERLNIMCKKHGVQRPCKSCLSGEDSEKTVESNEETANEE